MASVQPLFALPRANAPQIPKCAPVDVAPADVAPADIAPADIAPGGQAVAVRPVIERLRALVGTPRVHVGRMSCGHPALDDWLNGWPAPGLVEIAGLQGTGRLALVLPTLARLTRQGKTVILIDPLAQFYPPGALELYLPCVVLIRPPPEQAAWTAEQVARSGAVEAALLLDAPPLKRAGARLTRAVEAGRTTLFVVGEHSEPDVPAALRLHTEGWDGGAVRVQCVRSRGGRMEGTKRISFSGQVRQWPSVDTSLHP